MPWNYRPWGCGSGKNGSCNNGWLQFEICEDNMLNKSYFEEVYREACEISAYLCSLYGLNPHGSVNYDKIKVPVILCHADSYKLGLGNNHGDVYNWFKRYGKDMNDVRNDIAALMKANTNTNMEPVKPAAPVVFTPYLARVITDVLNIRKGAGTNYDVVGTVKRKGVYTIVEEASGKGATKWGKLKSGAGWISLDYTEKV
jgi:hypothetical protein